ncbi:MAG: family 16 glycosylhydrolase [Bacteroidota bacterium]
MFYFKTSIIGICTILLLSHCDEIENELDQVDPIAIENPAMGPNPVLSNCALSNDILFDAPVNNNINPVSRGNNGMGSWQQVASLSDEFNYPGGKSSPNFLSKWKLGFVNNFTGPLPTVWTGNQVTFETINGNNRAVVLTARQSGSGSSRTLQCGMISTFAKSSYPLFQEARVKISNSQIANAVWMLSGDPGTTEEIDNLETYGPRVKPDGNLSSSPFFGDRLHLSHHTFRVNGNERLDYQPQKETWMSRKQNANNCNRSNDVVWSRRYHIFGVKWESPTVLKYYVDGRLVKTINGLRDEDGIDPRRYTTCGAGLTRAMHMLISQASQTWRWGAGQTGINGFWNSGDVITGNNTKMFVDWIRVYTPTGGLNQRCI